VNQNWGIKYNDPNSFKNLSISLGKAETNRMNYLWFCSGLSFVSDSPWKCSISTSEIPKFMPVMPIIVAIT